MVAASTLDSKRHLGAIFPLISHYAPISFALLISHSYTMNIPLVIMVSKPIRHLYLPYFPLPVLKYGAQFSAYFEVRISRCTCASME